MATEVIDSIARADIDDHEASTNPHPGIYQSLGGEVPAPWLVLSSPNGNVWKLTIDDDGILTATVVEP
jgi:hypothetical protein